MMVRHYEIDFNSGALVFPGGSVDKGDKEIIASPDLYSGGEGLDEATLSFRIAAIRETFEESGILLARPKGSKVLVDAKTAGAIEAAHRADLCDGKISFLKVLTDNGMGYATPQELINGLGHVADTVYVHPEARTEFERLMERDGMGTTTAELGAAALRAAERRG